MPNPEQIREAIELIRKRSANYEYFFSELPSPDWIEPLLQNGLFSQPPSIHREGNSISFPLWPESKYLVRMARLAPEKVFFAISQIPTTDNVRIHDDFVKAALNMPGNLAAKIAEHEIEWIKKQEYLYFLFPGSLGDLIQHLAQSGEVETALNLAQSLLIIKGTDDRFKKCYAKFDSWEYEKILKDNFPSLLKAAQIKAFVLICDILEIAVKMHSEKTEKEDYSWIWRPAIEAHEQNTGHGDITDILVDTARDSASSLIKCDRKSYSDIVGIFKTKPYPIFKRINLYLLFEHVDLLKDEAKKEIENKNSFFDLRLHHEYSKLLEITFLNLNDNSKKQIFDWILSGPPVKENRETSDKKEKINGYWQLRWLWFLRSYLPNDLKNYFNKLVHEFGELEHPDFLSYHKTFWGPNSPVSHEQLDKMTVEEISQFLHFWKPTNTIESGNPEGLARNLQTIISSSPSKFISNLTLFLNINPTYARAIVHGIEDALRRNELLDWNKILEYLIWIIAQPRGSGRDAEYNLDQDPHWGWARKTVMSLLSLGFEKDLIPVSHRPLVWKIIEPVLEDPDPTPEDDNEHSMNSAEHSINSTRGEAMHTLVRYALWLYRQEEKSQKFKGKFRSNFDSMPEVKKALENHLRPDLDPSPAIRSVYGQWFPWLVLIDKEWVIENRRTIFPKTAEQLYKAAWNAYMFFCPVYDEPFKILQDEYLFAIEHLNASADVATNSAIEHLGEHIIVLIGRGILFPKNESDLSRLFFLNAPDDVTAHAIAYSGRSLMVDEKRTENTEDVPSEVIERFRFLWDTLFELFKNTSDKHIKTLGAFSWFFSTGRFDPTWSLKNLNKVLLLTKKTDDDYLIMEQLANMSFNDTENALLVLETLLNIELRTYTVFELKDYVKVILTNGLKNQKTKEKTESIIHVLGAKGYFQYRSLLG